MAVNSNDMDDEMNKRLTMVTCLRENAQNTVREFQVIERQYLEILSSYREADGTVDDLLDQNKIREYQTAFRQVYGNADETYDCLIRIQNLKIQMYKSAIRFVRYDISNAS